MSGSAALLQQELIILRSIAHAQASYANLEKTSGIPLSQLFAKSLTRAPASRLDPNWCGALVRWVEVALS